jgi:hypothetical protein
VSLALQSEQQARGNIHVLGVAGGHVANAAEARVNDACALMNNAVNVVCNTGRFFVRYSL